MASTARTPDQARLAFLSTIPRRREAFEKRVHERHGTIAHEHNFRERYPFEVLDMAKDELRGRNEDAARQIRLLLESGWRPTQAMPIDACFRRCFEFTDFREDPSADLYERIDASFGEVGRPVDRDLNYRRALGETQVQAANEAVRNLEMYVGAQAPRSMTFLGTVGAVQVGDHNVASVTQNINPAVDDLVSALTSLQAVLEKKGEEGAAVIADQARTDLAAQGFTPRVEAFLISLPRIAATVDGVEGLWELVRLAARPFGCELPALKP